MTVDSFWIHSVLLRLAKDELKERGERQKVTALVEAMGWSGVPSRIWLASHRKSWILLERPVHWMKYSYGLEDYDPDSLEGVWS